MSFTINVSHFGAVGDGVADDTKAIQNAIDNASGNHCIIEFEANKVYKISTSVLVGQPSCLLINFPNIIEIAGNSASLILDDGGFGDIIQVRQAHHIIISDLYIDGNKENTNKNTTGINIREYQELIQNITIKNITVENCRGAGIFLEGRAGSIEHIQVSNCYNPINNLNAGFQITNVINHNLRSHYQCKSLYVDSCQVGINITGGIHPNALITFDGNDIRCTNNFRGVGLKTAAFISLKIRNSDFSHNKTSGIFINYPAEKVELSNCSFWENEDTGCDLQQDATYVLDSLQLVNNTITGAKFGGRTEAQNIFLSQNGTGFSTSSHLESLHLKNFQAIDNKQGFVLQSGEVFITNGHFSGNRTNQLNPNIPLFDLRKGLDEVTFLNVDFSKSTVNNLFGFISGGMDLHLVKCSGVDNIITRSVKPENASLITEDGRRKN